MHAKLICRKHVWRDLHPFLCTVEGCDTADRIYQSRRAWFEHEVETHYTPTDTDLSPSCLLCGAQLSGFASLRVHMGRHQEQLALFALPLASRVVDDEDDDDDNEGLGASIEVDWSSGSL